MSDLRSVVLSAEVLFDEFPDGRSSAVGGATPSMWAWHLKGFGVDPLFIKRRGGGGAGTRFLERMDAWGMPPAWVAPGCQDRPSGGWRYAIEEGEPR